MQAALLPFTARGCARSERSYLRARSQGADGEADCYFSYSAAPTGTRRPHVPKGHLALARDSLKAPAIDERLITREEVVALLFNVSDIARLLERIQALLRGDDGEEDESRD